MADELKGQETQTPGQPLEPLETAEKEVVAENEETVAETKEAAVPKPIEDTPEFQSKLAKSVQTYQKKDEASQKEINRLKGELGQKQENALQKSLSDLPDTLKERGEIDEEQAVDLEKAIRITNTVRQDTNKRMEFVNAWMPKAKRTEELNAATTAIETVLGKDGTSSLTVAEFNEIADEFKDCDPGNEREYKLASRAAAAIVKAKFVGRTKEEGKEPPAKSGAKRPDSVTQSFSGSSSSNLENLSPAERVKARDKRIRESKK